MSKAVYGVFVDWDLDDYESEYADISADVIEIPKIMRGKEDQLGHAPAGICEVRLKDIAHKYSPENEDSPLYGLLLPYRPIRVAATFASIEYDLFNGFISKIVPHPHWAKQDCYIYATDGLEKLSKNIISTEVYTASFQQNLGNVTAYDYPYLRWEV